MSSQRSPRTARPMMSLQEFISTTKNPNGLIARPMLKTVQLLDPAHLVTKEESNLLAQNYIRNFVAEKAQETQATIIQNAFRRSRSRRHYKTFIRLRITQHRRIMRLCLILWKMLGLKNVLRLHRVYDQFIEFLPQVHFIVKGRQISNFRYFYTSGQLFIPTEYTHKMLYSMLFACNKGTLVYIFRLWNFIAHRKRIQKTALIFAESMNNKMIKFDAAFLCFKLWYNLHRYFKIRSEEDVIKMPVITVYDHDTIPTWLSTQNKYNQVREIQYKATVHYRKNVIKRSLKTLAENKKFQYKKNTILPNHLEKVNTEILKTSLITWIEFSNERRKKRNYIREFIRRWYDRTFKHSYFRTIDALSRRSEVKFTLDRAMRGWSLETRRRKFKYLSTMLSVQKKPLQAYMLIFLITGQFDLAFNALAFKLWLNIIRKKKAFKNFVDFHNQIPHDTELAFGSLTMLRSPDEGQNLFPSGIGMSLELSLNAQKLASRGKILSIDFGKPDTFDNLPPKAEKSGTFENLPPKAVKPDTFENLPTNEQNSDNLQADVRLNPLARLLLLAIHKKIGFDVFSTSNSYVDQIKFDKLRPEDELREQALNNAKILRSRLMWKLHRDNSLLTAIGAHSYAEFYERYIPEFRTLSEVTFFAKNDWIEPISGEVFVFDDFKVSVDALRRALDIASKRRGMRFLQEDRDAAMEELTNRVRKPSSLDRKPLQNFLVIKAKRPIKEVQTPVKQVVTVENEIEMLSKRIKNLSPDIRARTPNNRVREPPPTPTEERAQTPTTQGYRVRAPSFVPSPAKSPRNPKK